MNMKHRAIAVKDPERRRPGRPKAKDKTDHVVAFRLTLAELDAAESWLRRTGNPQTVNAFSKQLLLERTER